MSKDALTLLLTRISASMTRANKIVDIASLPYTAWKSPTKKSLTKLKTIEKQIKKYIKV